MKTQHTAEPWIIQEHKDKNFGIDLTEGKNGKVICNVTSHYIAEHEEAQANARLIAAAPELLAALQQLKDAFIHIEGNRKGNQAKTDIIKYNDDVRDALNNARIILDKAIAN